MMDLRICGVTSLYAKQLRFMFVMVKVAFGTVTTALRDYFCQP